MNFLKSALSYFFAYKFDVIIEVPQTIKIDYIICIAVPPFNKFKIILAKLLKLVFILILVWKVAFINLNCCVLNFFSVWVRMSDNQEP